MYLASQMSCLVTTGQITPYAEIKYIGGKVPHFVTKIKNTNLRVKANSVNV